MAEINATPGRLVWVQVNDENYQGYATEGFFSQIVGNVFASYFFLLHKRGNPLL